MSLHGYFSKNAVRATFTCEFVELPDQDLSQDTYQLAPSFFFGGQFRIEQREPSAISDHESPRRSDVTATLSKALYTLMIRYQQGAEASGDDPPAWALVEGSAVEIATMRVLETGEVFSFFPAVD